MESLQGWAWYPIGASAALTLLTLLMCLAGLLWAPVGASLAALYARGKRESSGDAAYTAALASVHFIVPWVYVMLSIASQRCRPRLEMFLHIGALVLWLLGPVLLLAQFGLGSTVFLILDRITNPDSHPPENNLSLVLDLVVGASTLVVAALCALSWSRSLGQVGVELQGEGQRDLWLPVNVAYSLRMTILWSAGSVVFLGTMMYISLVIWRETTVIW